MESRCAALSGVFCSERSVASVIVVVGASALTRMPSGAHSVESAAVRRETAPFAAEYTDFPASVLADQVELMLMIFP